MAYESANALENEVHLACSRSYHSVEACCQAFGSWVDKENHLDIFRSQLGTMTSDPVSTIQWHRISYIPPASCRSPLSLGHFLGRTLLARTPPRECPGHFLVACGAYHRITSVRSSSERRDDDNERIRWLTSIKPPGHQGRRDIVLSSLTLLTARSRIPQTHLCPSPIILT